MGTSAVRWELRLLGVEDYLIKIQDGKTEKYLIGLLGISPFDDEGYFMWMRPFLATFLVALTALGCGPSLKSVKWTEREEAVRRLAPEERATLAGLALQDPNARVRKAATQKVADPAVLERVALTDSWEEVRAAAVVRLVDQTALARVAIGNCDLASHKRIAEAAAAKLTDPRALERVAMEGTGPNVATYAQRKLPEPMEPALLARLALGARDPAVREAAIGKVVDQAVLAKVVLSDKESGPRQAALLRLTDQATLAKVALGDKISRLRRAAVDRLNDQAFLGQVALSSTDSEIAWAAVTHLQDQQALLKLATTTSNNRLLGHVLERLSPESRESLAETFYRRALAENTEAAFRAFIGRFPGTAQAKAASDNLRRRRFESVCATDTCAAYATFLAASPTGPESAEARRRLAAKGRWEKSKRLGELAIDMLPQMVAAPLSNRMHLAAPLAKPALQEFQIMLDAGADPRAVRIAAPSGQERRAQARFVSGVGFVFGATDRGTPVPVDQPGTPLLQFLEANKLTDALRLIQAHERRSKRR